MRRSVPGDAETNCRGASHLGGGRVRHYFEWCRDHRQGGFLADGPTSIGDVAPCAVRSWWSVYNEARTWLLGLEDTRWRGIACIWLCVTGERATLSVVGIVVAVVCGSCGGRWLGTDYREAPAQLSNGSRGSDSRDGQRGDALAASSAPDEVAPGCLRAQMDQCETGSWVSVGTPWSARIVRAGVRGRGCRTAPECEEKGWCAGHKPGECYQATEASCRESFGCKYEELCVVSGKICDAMLESDCEKSLVCGWAGQCGVGEGQCIATDEAQCRNSRNCRDKGLCALQGEICAARYSSDCTGAEICANHGRCHAVHGGCFALTSEDCASVCRKYGRCHWERGNCVVKSDADCEASEGCKLCGSRRCKLLDGECVTAAEVAGHLSDLEYRERMRW